MNERHHGGPLEHLEWVAYRRRESDAAYRAAILAAWDAGYSLREIADAADSSRTAVHHHIRAAGAQRTHAQHD